MVLVMKNYVETLCQQHNSGKLKGFSRDMCDKLFEDNSEHFTLDSAAHSPVSRTLSDSSMTYFDKQKLKHNRRKKVESEDSSYDSDHEALSSSHDSVSRTFSETLASEFTDYVSVSEEDPFLSDPNYHAKVEFSLKLGYPEILLRKALRKLGPSAGQDKLLAELIRLQNAKLDYVSGDESKRSDQPRISCEDTEGNALLPIVIDGSNVAMAHGNKERFSCKGIQLCVNWFRERGHRNITVFVPRWRKEASKPETPITDQHILSELEKERILSYTPSRQVGGRRVICHDDRYILNLASETNGIVVSNDNYRELLTEKPEYKEVITKRILMFSFVNDRFMPPDDPLGKNGPNLSSFLRSRYHDASPQPCPYGKKCTYGNKCKYFHADRGNHPQKSISDKIKEQTTLKINEVRARAQSRDSSPSKLLTRTMSVNLPPRQLEKQPLCRTQSNIPPRILEPRARPSVYPHLHMNRGDNKSQSFENISSGKALNSLSSSETENVWCNQFNFPPYTDLSLPPPPPPPPQTHWASQELGYNGLQNGNYSQLNVNSHLKLSRQLSLNPTYDSRILTYPPPTDIPPPYHHNLTRIASAPERPRQFGGVAPYFTYKTPDSHLHKSMSDSFQLDCAKENYNKGLHPTGHQANRSNLFIHLKAIFPENLVLQAMSALPEETEGQKLCEYIIRKNSLNNH